MKIRFTQIATHKLDLLTDYIIHEFSIEANRKFLERLNKGLSSLQSNPYIFPESETFKGLRKCVITKQTVLYYEVRNDTILVLTLFDSRQNPLELQKELNIHK